MVRDRRRHDVSLARRDVDEPADRSALWRDRVDLSVIGLDGVKRAPRLDHAVPGAVRLEVVGLGMCDGVDLLERAQIGDHLPRPVLMDANDPVGEVRDAVRAARAAKHRVEGIADKGDVGDAADEAALIGARLAGGQVVRDGRAYPVAVDHRHPRAGLAARVGPDGRDHLVALTHGRVRAAGAAFGDVEVAVRPELEPARIVQPGCKHGNGGGLRFTACRHCNTFHKRR